MSNITIIRDVLRATFTAGILTFMHLKNYTLVTGQKGQICKSGFKRAWIKRNLASGRAAPSKIPKLRPVKTSTPASIQKKLHKRRIIGPGGGKNTAKVQVLYNMKPRRLVDSYRRFEGICCPNLGLFEL